MNNEAHQSWNNEKLACTLMCMLLIAGGMFQGYYFELEYIPAAIASLLGITWLLYQRAAVRNGLVYMVLAYAAAYAVSISVAVDSHAAIMEFIKIVLAITMGWLGASLTESPYRIAVRCYIGTSSMSVLIALAAGQFDNGRLSGTLDYANAYAAALLAALILSQSYYVVERRMIWLLAQFVLTIGLGLTGSRTVMLLWLVSLIIMAIVLWEKPDRLRLWLQMIIASGLGIVVGALHAEYSIVIFMAATLLAILLLGQTDRIMRHAALRLTALGALAAALGIVVWNAAGFLGRWTGGFSQLELETRMVYYKDAIAMIRDGLWLGHGGGGWTQLQFQYQSSSYYVRYLHNQILQAGTDAGLVGMITFGGLIAVLLLRCVVHLREEPAGSDAHIIAWGRLAACAVLILHSFVDFTLTYPYLLGVLIMLGAGPRRAAHSVIDTRRPMGRLWPLLPLVCAILIAYLLAPAILYDRALRSIDAGREAQAVKLLDRVVDLGFFPDRAYDQKAKLYVRHYLKNRDSRYIAVAETANSHARRINPEQLYYRKLESDIHWLNHRQDSAIATLEDLTKAYPFNTRWREELAARIIQREQSVAIN